MHPKSGTCWHEEGVYTMRTMKRVFSALADADQVDVLPDPQRLTDNPLWAARFVMGSKK